MDLIICGTRPYKLPGHKVNQPCPQCGHRLTKQRSQECCCVWFIPIFPIGRGHHIERCKNCGWGPVQVD